MDWPKALTLLYIIIQIYRSNKSNTYKSFLPFSFLKNIAYFIKNDTEFIKKKRKINII